MEGVRDIRVKSEEEVVRGWRGRFRERAVREPRRQDGKYALLCTDPRLSAVEVVEAYLGKDFVEKAFRTLEDRARAGARAAPEGAAGAGVSVGV